MAQKRDFSKILKYIEPHTAIYAEFGKMRVTGVLLVNEKNKPVILSHGVYYTSPTAFCKAHANRVKNKTIVLPAKSWDSVKIFITKKSIGEVFDEGVPVNYE